MSDLICERHGRVLVATINREEKGNSIGGSLMADLLAASKEVESDDRLCALVVTARGRVWSSGGDPTKLKQGFGPGADASRLVHREGIGGDNGLPEISEHQLLFDRTGVGAWLPRYRDCGKPLIAAIDGAAVGGGFALALAHDLRIAGENARFRAAFNALGVGPELGTSWVLPRLVGTARATELIMLNRWVTAREADKMGLVNEVVPSGDLLSRAIGVAEEIAAKPAELVRSAMRVLRGNPPLDLEGALRLDAELARSRDRQP